MADDIGGEDLINWNYNFQQKFIFNDSKKMSWCKHSVQIFSNISYISTFIEGYNMTLYNLN